LAAKTGLIEALQPAGYEFETGLFPFEGGERFAPPFPRRHDASFEAGAATHLA
jgi:hypothetical protein